ncbi:hypothetical protein [Roseibium sp. SCP14]|uniref:hypothetical protein n=1 Tax=Roseibium sp. SCP14 TaxID=3141375 RepID=UPI00333ACEC4
MFGLFSRKKNVVDEEQAGWIVEQSAWLDKHIGFPNNPVPLITPTEHFFSLPPATGHERALHIFNEVKQLMGLQAWPCDLEAQDEDIDPRVNDMMIVQNAPQAPLGTFGVGAPEQQRIIITYSPNSLENPHSLIATFAHELSHYLLACCDQPRLYDEDQEEPLTDLLAIKCGFGLFLANSSFTFSQYSDGIAQGWRTSAQGYLTEREILFALMLFMRQNGHELDAAKPFLKAHLYGVLKKAWGSG